MHKEEQCMMKEKYETLPLATLRDLAKARGLKGVSSLKKADLIEVMLKEDEKENEKNSANRGSDCGCGMFGASSN